MDVPYAKTTGLTSQEGKDAPDPVPPAGGKEEKKADAAAAEGGEAKAPGPAKNRADKAEEPPAAAAI